MAYDRKKLIRQFRKLYENDEYVSQIMEIIAEAHGKKSVVIDYDSMSNFDPVLAEMLPEDPDLVISSAEEALRDEIKSKYGLESEGLHVRFYNFPEAQKTSIRHLRSADVGKFVVIEALVKKASEVRPKMVEAAFRCGACNTINYIKQHSTRLSEPNSCEYCDATRLQTSFVIVPGKSKFVDEERLEVQELPEKLQGGQQPQRMIALAEDDVAGILSPGDRVVLYGVLKAVPRTRGNVKSTTFDFIFQVNYVEKENKEYTDIEPDEEDIRKIEEIAHSGKAVEKLVRSIAPSIYGHDDIKKALALQLFGGVAKELPGGTRVRGDIHILLVGDPGTAKSQMLKYMSDLSPRGIYASGKSASAAGLTAAAVKDEGSDGRWTLEAGALVMADGGMACIDEMDKMSKDDRSSMHEAMEQQTITVVKAGISATLKSRCSILGAANPKYGRFSKNAESHFEEIDLPPPLISRFDVIFIMQDRQDPRRDRDIAEHILKGHRIGEMLRNNMEIDEEEAESHTSVLDKELMKKYVSYAKRKNPILTDRAMNMIEKYYLDTRKKGAGSGTVAITARHLEAMVRMAEASARIRLSDSVEEEDAAVAIDLMETYLSKVLNYDIDMQYTGESQSTRNKKKAMMEILDILFSEHEEVTLKQIKEMAAERGLPATYVEETIDKIHREGAIYERRSEVYVRARKD